MRKRMKLFHKTFLYMLAMFGVLILIVHLAVYLFLPRFYIADIKKGLDEELAALEEMIGGIDQDSLYNVLESYGKKQGLNIVAEIDGKKYSFQNEGPLIDAAFDSSEEIQLENVEDIESVLFRYGRAVTKDQKEVSLRLTESTTPVKDAKEVTLSLLPLTTLLSLCISLLFSYFYSKKITKPILEMVQITKSMEQLQEEAYFHVKGQDEIGILAAQINRVYEQLWKTIQTLEAENRYITEMERQKVDFLRGASHELKTPLATLRILLENMQYNVGKYKEHEKYLPQGIQQVDRLTQMVQEILDTSKLQSQDKKERIFLKEEIEEILKIHRIQIHAKEYQVGLEMDPAACIEMDKDVFRRVFMNLVGNAVKYSHKGGKISLSLEEQVLKIQNTCTPLTEEQLSHVFEAFYRPDFSRNQKDGGNGLGLYIVKELLTVWHIPCSFEGEAEGMCFSMDLTAVWKKTE